MFQDGANTGSSQASDDKRKLVSAAEHFPSPKRAFDSIGYYSDMEQAAKRNGLTGISRRRGLISTERASDLSRPARKAFDSVEDIKTDAGRGSISSVDQWHDARAALKRVFDSIGDMSDLSGVQKRFDSIAHYSDMKRNEK